MGKSGLIGGKFSPKRGHISPACALIVAYGPGFLHAVLDDAPEWISTAALEAQQAALEAEHDRIARQLAALRGQI